MLQFNKFLRSLQTGASIRHHQLVFVQWTQNLSQSSLFVLVCVCALSPVSVFLSLLHPLRSLHLSFVFPSSLRSVPAVRPAEPSSIRWSSPPQRSLAGLRHKHSSSSGKSYPGIFSNTPSLCLLLSASAAERKAHIFTKSTSNKFICWCRKQTVEFSLKLKESTADRFSSGRIYLFPQPEHPEVLFLQPSSFPITTFISQRLYGIIPIQIHIVWKNMSLNSDMRQTEAGSWFIDCSWTNINMYAGWNFVSRYSETLAKMQPQLYSGALIKNIWFYCNWHRWKMSWHPFKNVEWFDAYTGLLSPAHWETSSPGC